MKHVLIFDSSSFQESLPATGLKEEDNILSKLFEMHEEVPLGDPGPNIAGEDGEGGGCWGNSIGCGEQSF